MASTRRVLLVGVVGLLMVLTATILFDVLGTVFFAITVAYVLVPFHRRLMSRGLSSWMASAVTTVVAFLATILLFLPIAAILYLRRNTLLALLRRLPESVTLELVGYGYTVDTGTALTFVSRSLSAIALDLAAAMPVLAIKFTLFGTVIFGLLVKRRDLRGALLAPVPHEYHDIVEAFHVRVREVLSAIYVLQAATAAGTFAIAWPLFFIMGYRFSGTIAVIAAILQFLPIVGPSVLVLLVVAYELTLGTAVKAVAIGVLGMGLVAWLPDVLIRPRLAQSTARLPGSLYFVGFTGGLLSLGAVGVIAGPLAVALLGEAVNLLAAELNGTDSV